MRTNDIVLGRTAVSSGLITQAQLDECIREFKAAQAGRKTAPPTSPEAKTLVLPSDVTVLHSAAGEAFSNVTLATLLVGKGYLTQEQLTKLMAGQPHVPATGLGEESAAATGAREAGAATGAKQAGAVEQPRATEPARTEEGPAGISFGRYSLLEELGRGGMGIVYRALDSHLSRQVAIKVMADAFTASETDKARFEREARALAKLRHPNIIQIHDIGAHEAQPYYTMDLLEGEPLDRVLKRMKRLPQDTALRIAAGASDAVHHAHVNGIIHRDIKPANIFLELPRFDGEAKVDSMPSRSQSQTNSVENPLVVPVEKSTASQQRHTEERMAAQVEMREAALTRMAAHRRVLHPSEMQEARVILTDFGLVRDVSSVASRKLTASGFAVGTPQYMSPEQASGASRRVGPQSDVFALGVTLYEMLTGRHPFDALTVPAILTKVVQAQAVSPRTHLPELGREAETVILKAMAKSPADRYATAKDFGDDLRRLLNHQPVAVRPPGLSRRMLEVLRRHRLAATFVCLFLLAAAVAAYVVAGPGYVTIESTPPGARVLIDGLDIGLTTPVHNYVLWPFRQYRIAFVLDEYERTEREIKLSARQSLRVEQALVPLFGFVTVNSEPAGAEFAVRAGGASQTPAGADVQPVTGQTPATQSSSGAGWRVVGTTPIRLGKVALTECQYRLVLQGYEPVEGIAAIRREEPATVIHALKRQTGLVSMTANAGGGEAILSFLGYDEADAKKRQEQAATQKNAAAGAVGTREMRIPLPAEKVAVPAGFYAISFALLNHHSDAALKNLLVEPNGTREVSVTFRPMWIWRIRVLAPGADTEAVPLPVPDQYPVTVAPASGTPATFTLAAGPVMGVEDGRSSEKRQPLVVACFARASLGTRSISPKDGGKGWMTMTVLAAKHVVSVPALGDLNGDGILDIVGSGAKEETSRLCALSGSDGTLLWELAVPSSRPPQKEFDFFNPALADLDGDGSVEVVVGASDCQLYAFATGSGTGVPPVKNHGQDAHATNDLTGPPRWTYKVGAYVNSAPLLADLTSDGVPDVIVSANDYMVRAISGASGKVIWTCKIPDRSVPYTPLAGDINGDGVLDIVVRTAHAFFAISGARGTLLWEAGAPAVSCLDGRPTFALADLNGDKCPDIVMASAENCVRAVSGIDGQKLLWEFPGEGAFDFAPSVAYVRGAAAPQIVAATPQIVAASDDGNLYVFDSAKGALCWKYEMHSPPVSQPFLVDLDGDGTPEIVVSTADDNVHAIRW